MIPILTHGDGFIFGLADHEKEMEACLTLRFENFKQAGFYHHEVTSDRDAHDTDDPFVFMIKRAGEIVGTARYVKDLGGFPLEKAFQFQLPSEVVHINRSHILDGGKIAVKQRLPAGLTSAGLIAATHFYFAKSGNYHLTLHCTFDRWASKISSSGLLYRRIQESHLIYPKDGPMGPYYYNLEPIHPYYCLIKDNVGPSQHICAALGLHIEAEFRPS